MTREYRYWTPEEDAELLRLYEVERLFFYKISLRLGRPKKSASDRYAVLKRRRGELPPKPARKPNPTALRDGIRAHEIERTRAGHASITAMVFGDPPPGHSALDQKMGTYCR